MRPIYDLPSAFADQVRTAETEAGRVYEPMIALVTDNKDPQKLGRVKIKLPVLSDADTTWWAPIVMLGAGKNRGWFFIPEPDDEVLVLFEHGEMSRPLVVGALWNGKDKAPDANPDGDNPRRVIRSRGGSKVIFDDKDGKIVIEDGAGAGKITFDAGGKKIQIEALAGDVCIQAPADELKIVADSAELTAGQNIEIHAGAAMAWDAGGAGVVKGSAITLAGSNVYTNSGKAQAVTAATASPADVADPYKS